MKKQLYRVKQLADQKVGRYAISLSHLGIGHFQSLKFQPAAFYIWRVL